MTLEFIASVTSPDYLTAKANRVSYTICGPRPALSPFPWGVGEDVVEYTDPVKWTASRMPNNDFLSAVVGKFYLTRHDSLDEAQQACHDDHEVIERVRLWFEFMKINDVRQLLGAR